MEFIGRRQFIEQTLAGSSSLFITNQIFANQIKSLDSRIEILINEPIGTITPDIYGHFIEHLGGVIYDGVWVGEGSKIANINGIRSALIEHMRRLKAGVMRWPGGCFADSYDWRDGIGPMDKRPHKTNFWNDNEYMITEAYKQVRGGPQKYDPNQFGTNEFMRFCNLIGSKPYLAANVRSLPAKSFYEWVEYCNAPAEHTTLSSMRAAGGSREPFNVQFWGIGNESWGCGGEMTAEEYATEYKKFVAWIPTYGQKLFLIGAGPNGGDLKWTRNFFTKLVEKGPHMLNFIQGWALHYYCGSTGKLDAHEYNVDEWYQLLGQADRMESLINQHWSIMGEIDTNHRVKLIVDEWGAWHKQDSQLPPSYLFGYAGTLRDALVAGITLNIFNNHTDKIVMANVAQLINTIHSLFIAYEDKFIATPNFHVFEMYAAHYGGKAVRTIVSAPKVSYKKLDSQLSLWGLQASASIHGKQLILTVVNPYHNQPRETEISIRGAAIRTCQAKVLTSTDIHAYNSFAKPNVIDPKNAIVNLKKEPFVYEFQPASVTRLQIELQ